MRELLRTFGPLATPLVLVLVWSYRALPTVVFIIVLGYVGLLCASLAISWPHKFWIATNDRRKEHFKQLMMRVYSGLLATILLVPVVCMTTYKMGENVPVWLDDLVRVTIEDENRPKRLEKEGVRIDQSLVVAGQDRSYVAVIGKRAVLLFPTRLTIELALVPLVSLVTPLGGSLWLLSACFLIGLKIAETLGEGAYQLKRRSGSSAS